MQPIIIFIIIVIVVTAFYVPGLFKKMGGTTQDQNSNATNTPATQTKNTGNTSGQKPSVYTGVKSSNATTSSFSPNFGKVKFGAISHTSIDLSSQITTSEKIDITGWKIKGSKGEITIPQGVELFIPGTSIPNSDIVVKQYDVVHIYTKSNPFSVNKNFRPNKCFGYLNDYYQNSGYYYSKICPTINRDDICNFTQECQNAIMSLQNCSSQGYSNNLYVVSNYACQTYADNYISRYLNYDGCIGNYSKDKDFYSNSWDIYLGYDIVCKCDDVLYLYDRNGLLVDQYSYQGY